MIYHTDQSALANLGPEVRKTYGARIESGFFDRYLGGRNVVDIGYKGANPSAVPILPHAVGVDRDFPGYDGIHLPFTDSSLDAVHSSHCLEHIPDPIGALRDWFRVLRIGGFLVLTVPHAWLYERKAAPTSRFGGNEHHRFYTVAGLATEIEKALPIGEWRLRSLRDNDTGFDYSRPPVDGATGCYEIEAVVEKIARSPYSDFLTFSAQAQSILACYTALISATINGAPPPDEATLTRLGQCLPAPPFAVILREFPDVDHRVLRALLGPAIDASAVDVEWYTRVHPDVQRWVDAGGDAREHYRTGGYFERKLPRLIDPVWG